MLESLVVEQNDQLVKWISKYLENRRIVWMIYIESENHIWQELRGRESWIAWLKKMNILLFTEKLKSLLYNKNVQKLNHLSGISFLEPFNMFFE